MIHIKYKLGKSAIHGIGIFADQDIKEGQIIYTASPILDVDITQDQFDSLTEEEKKEVTYWGFWIESEKVWHVDFDNSKFINHSFTPSTKQNPSHSEAYLVATRDISSGEEFTQNYLDFDDEETLKRRGIELQ